MRLITICITAMWLLTACEVSVDPLGMTERTQIRANAAVQIQQSKSAAAIAEAQAEQRAREAEAQALVDAEAERQAGMNRRYATVAMFAPVVVVSIGVVLIVLLIIHWRGKIAFEQTCWRALNRPHTPPTLPREWRQALARRGCELEYIDNQWQVVTPQGRMMPLKRMMLEVK